MLSAVAVEYSLELLNILLMIESVSGFGAIPQTVQYYVFSEKGCVNINQLTTLTDVPVL